MPVRPKYGPLTVEEITVLWKRAVDPVYAEGFIQAGQGRGIEVHEQSFEQMARLSLSIDRSKESLFVRHWSGATASPASGPSRSRVDVNITRVGQYPIPLVLGIDMVELDQEDTDYGPNGPVFVRPGRRYVAKTQLVLLPGDAGPLPQTYESIVSGTGANNAPPTTVGRFDEVGAGYTNDGATVVATPGGGLHNLIASAKPDVPVLEHVGRYVVMLSGANAGTAWRVVGYSAPQNGDGGSMLLSPDGLFELSAVAGAFLPGEKIIASSGELMVLRHQGGLLFATRTAGAVQAGDTLIGELSGAAATVDAVQVSPEMVSETGTAEWRVLSWEVDLGLRASNPDWPSGGAHAVLDEVGNDRGVPRTTGEPDEAYRGRVGALVDAVSPNAILRAVNRVLAPYGLEARLLEVGQPGFLGMYFDGDPSSNDPVTNFAYDIDFTLRPQDRWKVNLDLLEARAFFLIEVPRLDLGEFGAFYDVGISNAYDSAPWLTFFDGFPIEAAIVYRSVWAAAEGARAGGVGFDLVLAP